MNDRETRDLEARLADSLRAAAPIAAPDLADRLLRRTAAADQRRAWTGWSMMAPALGAAAVLALAVVVGLQLGGLLSRPEGPPVGTSAPSGSPSPTEPATPSAEPTPSPSQVPPPSAGVFPDGQSCENETLGFRVGYLADWFANEAVVPDDEALDPVPACQYFGEGPMEIAPNAGLPPSVAIIFSREPEAPPPGDGNVVLGTDEVTVAGRPATVTEVEGTTDNPFFGAGDRAYGYTISLPDGEVLLVSTTTDSTGDYEAHKEVLDRMMETLVLTGS